MTHTVQRMRMSLIAFIKDNLLKVTKIQIRIDSICICLYPVAAKYFLFRTRLMSVTFEVTSRYVSCHRPDFHHINVTRTEPYTFSSIRHPLSGTNSSPALLHSSLQLSFSF